MKNGKGLGGYFKEVFIPEIRVSKDFVDSFHYIGNPKGSILHFCERQCTQEIQNHIQVKEGTIIDYEWLRSLVQLEKRRPITNPLIVGYVVRGMVITMGEIMLTPIPEDTFDILVHADGTWEKYYLDPEDDIVTPYINSLPKDVQESFEEEAREFWENDHYSLHEAHRVYSSPHWNIAKDTSRLPKKKKALHAKILQLEKDLVNMEVIGKIDKERLFKKIREQQEEIHNLKSHK